MPPLPRRRRLIVIVMALLASLLPAPLAAQTACDSHAGRLADLHTREQLKQFVHCAAQHVETVGWEQALQDFTGSDWQDGPLALFAATIDGQHLFAHGVDIAPGSDLWEWRDSDNVPIVQQQARIARDFGGGFVYYRIENIASGLEEPKESYVLRMDYQGEPAFIGAGLHPQDTHATCSPEVVRASLVYTERDLERFVACAEHYLQRQGLQAVHDFNTDPRWISGPTYLALFDLETLFAVANAGQPHTVGTIRDAAAYEEGRVRTGPESQRILSSHDDGYVYYTVRNPVTGEEGRKSTYVRRFLFDGRPWFLASGLYLPADDCRHLPLARDVDTRAGLQQFVRCAAQLVEERGELAWDLFLHHPQWIGGATYLFVLDENCDYLAAPVYPAGVSNAQCDFVDVEGTPVDQEIRARVTGAEGEGWVRYVLENPVSGVLESKESYVVGVTLNGELISVAAGLYQSQMRS